MQSLLAVVVRGHLQQLAAVVVAEQVVILLAGLIFQIQ
jgi:hypothetical protein